MTVLFVLGLCVWAIVLTYSLPSAMSAFGRTPRKGDPMRAGVAVVAVIFVAGSLRWLVAPDSEGILSAIFVLVIGAGFFVLWLMRSYGRGPNV